MQEGYDRHQSGSYAVVVKDECLQLCQAGTHAKSPARLTGSALTTGVKPSIPWREQISAICPGSGVDMRL